MNICDSQSLTNYEFVIEMIRFKLNWETNGKWIKGTEHFMTLNFSVSLDSI